MNSGANCWTVISFREANHRTTVFGGWISNLLLRWTAEVARHLNLTDTGTPRPPNGGLTPTTGSKNSVNHRPKGSIFGAKPPIFGVPAFISGGVQYSLYSVAEKLQTWLGSQFDTFGAVFPPARRRVASEGFGGDPRTKNGRILVVTRILPEGHIQPNDILSQLANVASGYTARNRRKKWVVEKGGYI